MLTLPPELITEVISKLDLPGQLNLRQTSHEMNSMVLSTDKFWIRLTRHKEEETKRIDQIKILVEEDPGQVILKSIPVEKKIRKFKQRYAQYPRQRRYPHCLTWRGIALSTCVGMLSGTIFSMSCCFDSRTSGSFVIYLIISWLIALAPFLGGYILFSVLYSSKSCREQRLVKFREKRDQKYKNIKQITRGTIFSL